MNPAKAKILGLVASVSKPKRIATLTRDLSGKFTKWKTGEVVRATHLAGSSYSIEKLRKKKNSFPLTSSLAGVPRSALKFQNA